MANYIFTMVKLRKNINGKDILKDIYLSFFRGAKIGIVGSNGAGKSTILRIMAGLDKDFSGEAFAEKGVKIGYLPQEPVLNPNKNVLENIEEAVSDVKELIHKFDALNERLGEELSADEMDKILAQSAILQDQIEAKDGWNLERSLSIAMDALRCPPAQAEIKNLSGGELRRVALCKLLLEKPDLLLLDEPTNHLDAESIQWLERYLKDFMGTIVIVTHDRYFLDNVTQWVLELDRGEGIPWHGNYSSWLAQKTKRLAEEEKQESVRQRTLKRELEWLNLSPKARQAKSKWRISAYQDLVKEQGDKVESNREIIFPPAPRLGDKVIEACKLSKTFDDKLLFEELNFKLPPGGIVGVIGPNGAGKSTLFKLMMQLEQADSGELLIGETVKISYIDQNRAFLGSGKTVYQELSDGKDVLLVGNKEIAARSYIASFGFKGADQQKLVDKLSGGERNRLYLAKLIMNGGNLLLLDEPTNDLDVDTLRALEDALISFPGCAVVISHDRWFLDRIATHILAFEGESRVIWFEGNYQDYMLDKRRRMGDDAVSPRPLKFKKLVH